MVVMDCQGTEWALSIRSRKLGVAGYWAQKKSKHHSSLFSPQMPGTPSCLHWQESPWLCIKHLSSTNFCNRDVCALSHFSHVWFFATSWTIACQAPPSMGFSRQEYQSGFSFPSSRDFPNSRIKPRSPTLQADFTIWATREVTLLPKNTSKQQLHIENSCCYMKTSKMAFSKTKAVKRSHTDSCKKRREAI